MGTKTLYILKPHLDWITKSFVNDFCGNMLWILCSLWVFVCNYVLYSVRLLIGHILSIQASADGENEHTAVEPREDCLFETNNSENDGTDGFEGKEMDEDDDGVDREQELTEDSNLLETSSASRASKYQFTSSSDIRGFMEEPTLMRFSFQKFYVGQNIATPSDHRNIITGVAADKDVSKLVLEAAASNRIQTTLSKQYISDDVGLENQTSLQHVSSGSGDLVFKVNSLASEDSISCERHSFDAEAIVFEDHSSLASEINSESAYSINFVQGSSDKVDNSVEYDFQSIQTDVAEELGVEEEPVVEIDEEKVEDEEFPLCETLTLDIKDQNFHFDDEYIELEPGVAGTRIIREHILPEQPDLYRVVSSETKEKEEQGHPFRENDLSKTNFDEKDELDYEWEHEDILEQLKLELRNARTGGLPTIMEEENEGEAAAETSESPVQVVEVLHTLKIDQKIDYKDRITEIQKFYKSYAEKMRKLDVLNYQTMHAIGLLPLKDPVRIIPATKAVVPDTKSVISQNIWPRKAWKNTEDPILKFVGELHRDLELVYVGQACLSWEILRWQHEKVQELKEYDSLGCHQYNQVAGEFQLFQVLLQRFIENQPFQGPRIRNYVKNRCVIRSLLQVPAVRDDNMNDKNLHCGDEEDAISSERLKEIIEESMHIFGTLSGLIKSVNEVV